MIDFKSTFKIALNSLRVNKMRSALTSLGIIIGVAAVIVLVSLVNGFANDMAESFESLGTNLLTVNIRGRGGNIKLTPIEVMEFAEENWNPFFSSFSFNALSEKMRFTPV